MYSGRCTYDSKSRESDEPSPSADWKKLAEEWVTKRFGRLGIVVLALIFAACTIWWQWDQIAKLPGIAELIKVVSREALPQADPKTFSVAVAHLEGDANGDEEKNLLYALSNFVHEQSSGQLSIQILRFDRTIELKGGDWELAVRKGHNAARQLLAKSCAEVLLWGQVLREGNQTRYRLFWTAASSAPGGKERALYALEDFELPAVFRTDLTQWLGLLVESQAAEFSKLEGKFAVVRLTPFIE